MTEKYKIGGYDLSVANRSFGKMATMVYCIKNVIKGGPVLILGVSDPQRIITMLYSLGIQTKSKPVYTHPEARYLVDDTGWISVIQPETKRQIGCIFMYEKQTNKSI